MKKALLFILISALCLGALCSCGADASEIEGLYKIQKNIYYASLVDRAYNNGDGYTVTKQNGKTVLFVNHTSISGEIITNEIGELKGFTLKKSNFDEIIFGESWEDGTSAESLRKANSSAWKVNGEGEDFYVMLQKDGTVLLASIKTQDGVKSCAYIRKMYYIEAIPLSLMLNTEKDLIKIQ